MCRYEDWKCAECCQGDRCNYYVTVSFTIFLYRVLKAHSPHHITTLSVAAGRAQRAEQQRGGGGGPGSQPPPRPPAAVVTSGTLIMISLLSRQIYTSHYSCTTLFPYEYPFGLLKVVVGQRLLVLRHGEPLLRGVQNLQDLGGQRVAALRRLLDDNLANVILV